MNTTTRTITFVAVAALAAVAALGARYANRPASVEGFSDVGQEFFADFKDPLKAAALSVVKYDTETKEPLSFAVNQDAKGLWVIPSHHDYPAEAKERLARTAASLIGIRKVAMQSRSKEDWARYGVIDPSEEAAADLSTKADEKDESRGTRITLRDTSSNALVDLIVGKPVADREKHFYVRQPDKNPVFIAKVEGDLSAKFSDWIEPDLLKVNQNDINSLVVDRYSVDEAQGAIIQGELLKVTKDKTSNKWALDGLNPEIESLKELPINDLARNIDQLKIVGVRPKPDGLNADLTVSPEVAQNPLVRQMLQSDMQRQGFFIASGPDGQVKLVSNEGELVAGTSNGVRYTLYFGEVARGSAKDIETGLNDPKPDAAAPAEGAEVATGDAAKSETTDPAMPEIPKAVDDAGESESGPRRYLLVKVDYDESLLGPVPTEPVAPVKPEILNDATAPGDAAPTDAAPTTTEPPAAEPAAPVELPTVEPAAPDAPPTAPTADEPVADAPAEKPADPGSCDEPPAADAPVADQPATDAATAEAPAPAAQEAAVTTESPASATTPQDATATPPVDASIPVVPVQLPPDPKVEAQQQYDQALGDYEAAKAGYEEALKSRAERAKDGQKLVDELSQRFSAWYYVISADSFEKFKVSRADLVGPKEEPKPATGAAPGLGGPDVPGFDLPPGLGN